MQKYHGNFQDEEGNALVSGSVTVYDTGTSNLTDIYSDEAFTPKSNPITLGADGMFSFYAADGDYDIKATKAGYTDQTILDVQFLDRAGVVAGQTASSIGIAYFFDNETDRDAEAGASTGEQCLMLNTAQNRTDDEVGKVYRWSGAAWVYQYTLVIVGSVYDGDFDQNNNYRIRGQTDLDSWPFPYLRFNGVDDYVQVPDNANLNFGTGNGVIDGFIRTSSDHSASAVRIFEKRDTPNLTGYILSIGADNKLSFNFYHGALSNIVSDNTINGGLLHHFLLSMDRDGNLTMYIDASIQTDTDAIDATDSTSTDDLYIGSDEGTTLFYEGDFFKLRLWNRLLTSDEIKKYSNPLMALEWVDQGASQTTKNISTCVNSNYTSFANGTATGFDAISNGAATHRAGTADEISVIKGKKYSVKFDEVLNYGTAPTVGLKSSIGGTGISEEGSQSSANGSNELIFTATTTTTGVIEFLNNSTATDFEITNLNIISIGCIYEADFRNASPEQAKDTQNGNHGLIDGAELVNTPVSPVYKDIYKAVSDNDTFEIPANTTELQIVFNVKTLEAGTTVRIGTADGGQQVVADVATATAGPITATMVLTDSLAADTLYIGSDGGAAWTTLVLDVHVNYTVIDIN